MSRVMKTMAWTLLVALVLSAALIAAAVSMLGPLDPVMIRLDDAPRALAEFDAGRWLVATVAVLLALVVALLVLLVVVPVAVLVPLLVAALVLVGALVLVAAVTALAFSPLILCAGLVWLIWRFVRGHGRRAQAAAKGSATIAG